MRLAFVTSEFSTELVIRIMPNKFKTAARLLVRPRTYPFLLRTLRSRITGAQNSLESTRGRAEKWCHRRTVSTANGLRTLGMPGELIRVRIANPVVFAAAEARVAASPQKMGGGADADLLYTLACNIPANTVLETGVAYGWSSLALLLALRARPAGRVVSTNLHYRKFGDETFVGCAVPNELKSRWTIHRGPDAAVLPVAIADAGAYELCHYDSDKSYAGRMASYALLWAGLKVGGVFVSDDIGDNLAFSHFTRMTGHAAVVVTAPATGGDKYVGLIRKLHARPLRQWMF